MIVKCFVCNLEKRIPPSRNDGRTHFCSRSCYYIHKKGQPSKLNTRVNINCLECAVLFAVPQARLSTAKFCSKACKHRNMDNGLTTANEKDRKSLAYRMWRKAVFERDHYTCVSCGVLGGSLQADHIKPFALFEELRFVLSNGRTLCFDCHKKTDTYGRSNIFRNLSVNRQA